MRYRLPEAIVSKRASVMSVADPNSLTRRGCRGWKTSDSAERPKKASLGESARMASSLIDLRSEKRYQAVHSQSVMANTSSVRGSLPDPQFRMRAHLAEL